MKKLLFIAILFAACKKPTNENKVQIHIRESVSGAAVPAAAVKLIRCNFGCPFGGTILFNEQTDANGNVYVPASNFTDATGGMGVEKAKYWSTAFTTATANATLIPEGWMRIRIVKGASYPAGATFKLVINSQVDHAIDIKEFPMANDSVILVRGFGAQNNQIDWQVSGSTLYNNGTFNQQVPKFDTVKNITINY